MEVVGSVVARKCSDDWQSTIRDECFRSLPSVVTWLPQSCSKQHAAACTMHATSRAEELRRLIQQAQIAMDCCDMNRCPEVYHIGTEKSGITIRVSDLLAVIAKLGMSNGNVVWGRVAAELGIDFTRAKVKQRQHISTSLVQMLEGTYIADGTYVPAGFTAVDDKCYDKCYECKFGQFALRKNSPKQCRSDLGSGVKGAMGHTACNWRDDVRTTALVRELDASKGKASAARRNSSVCSMNAGSTKKEQKAEACRDFSQSSGDLSSFEVSHDHDSATFSGGDDGNGRSKRRKIPTALFTFDEPSDLPDAAAGMKLLCGKDRQQIHRAVVSYPLSSSAALANSHSPTRSQSASSQTLSHTQTHFVNAHAHTHTHTHSANAHNLCRAHPHSSSAIAVAIAMIAAERRALVLDARTGHYIVQDGAGFERRFAELRPRSLCLPPSLSLSHTLTHSHTHTLSLILSLSLSLPLALRPRCVSAFVYVCVRARYV